MGLFSSKSSTSSVTQVENKQVGVAEGGFGVGSNSTVSIQNLSADVAEDALAAVTDVSGKALGGIQEVATVGIRQTGDTARDALDFGEDVQVRSFDFARDFVEVTAENNNRARAENFQLARQTGELIAAQAGVVAPAAIADQLKGQNTTLLLLAGMGLIGFFIFKKK